MLLHELSCPKVRLLLSVLMLKDAGRNYDAVAGVDVIVSHESRHFADDGHKALIDQLRHLLGVTHTLEPPHHSVHSFSLPPPKRGRDPSGSRLALISELKYEGLQGLAQLRRMPRMRTSPY